MKNDHRSKFSNLSNCTGTKKPEKTRASTGFESVTSANSAVTPRIGSEVTLFE